MTDEPGSEPARRVSGISLPGAVQDCSHVAPIPQTLESRGQTLAALKLAGSATEDAVAAEAQTSELFTELNGLGKKTRPLPSGPT